jgi:hypothetical protein
VTMPRPAAMIHLSYRSARSSDVGGRGTATLSRNRSELLQLE